MTAEQRRVTLAVCLIVGMSLLMAAGLTFLVTPMAQEMGLSKAVVEDVLAMPSVAALIMVFSAGQLGDRLGGRRTLMFASGAFSVGAGLLMFSGIGYPIEIGLAICGAAAVTVQIVGVSLLQQATVGGRPQVIAFTTFGVVFPLAFLVFPVGTARLLQVWDWKAVPAIWVVAGIAMLVITRFMLSEGERARSSGEWITPLLAGIAFAAGARSIAEVDDLVPHPGVVAVGVVVALVAGLACFVLTRREHATFTMMPIRGSHLPVLLIAVALVSLSGLLTYVSIAIEYLYEMTPYEASIAVIPAQIGAILGAKFLAQYAMQRWGGVQAARILMLLLALAMLPLLMLQVGSPLWFLTGLATVFSFLWMGALTVLNTEVMRRAPKQSTGVVSSFRTASSSLGAALGVGILGTIVVSSLPVEAGAEIVGLDQLAALTDSLRLSGVVASAVALVGWVVLSSARRSLELVASEP